MNRRGFLHGILALGAAPAIVRIGSLMPVRSIVVPTTAETIEYGYVAGAGLGNTILTIDMITREALRLLEKNITMVRGINQSFEEEFKKCDTVTIRRPKPYELVNQILKDF